MKHRVTVEVETKKRGLFGSHYVTEKRVVEMNDREYRQYQRNQRRRPFTLEELMEFEILFGDDDD